MANLERLLVSANKGAVDLSRKGFKRLVTFQSSNITHSIIDNGIAVKNKEL